MTALIGIQRRLAEVGRIRIGQKVPTSGEKTRPEKLTTFRLTSPDRRRIEQAAGMYGGRPEPWTAPAGDQWEVVTETDTLDVVVPPTAMAFSQFYEQWAKGGCARRCDGVHESISDGDCVCDPDARECTIHTRLSVMLRDLAGLGVWRLDTSGYYAAVELGGAVDVVQMAAGRGRMLPARLRLEQRAVKRQGEGVRRFAVPVLDIDVSPGELLAGASDTRLEDFRAAAADVPALPAVEPPRLTPVPASLPSGPVRSVAEQVAAAPKPRKPRKGAAQPLPPTDRKPRTAAQAAAGAGKGPIQQLHEQEAAEAREGLSDAQRKLLHARLNEVAGLNDDDVRHDLVGLVTGGRTRSSTELTGGDLEQLLVVADLVEADALSLEWTSDGGPWLVKPDGAEVRFPLDVEKTRAWLAKRKTG